MRAYAFFLDSNDRADCVSSRGTNVMAERAWSPNDSDDESHGGQDNVE